MELYQPTKLTKEFKDKYCGTCRIKDVAYIECEAHYLIECAVINNQIDSLGILPCGTCAFLQVDDNRQIFCQVHNCKYYTKSMELKK